MYCLLNICDGWLHSLHCNYVFGENVPYDMCINYRKRFFLGLPSPKQIQLTIFDYEQEIQK